MNSPLGWTGLSQASYLTAAFAAMLLTVWLADRWRRGKVSSRAVMVGLTLSTTTQEHISVELGRKDTVYIA